MKYKELWIRIILRRFGKKVRGGYYISMEGDDEAVIEVKSWARFGNKIRTFYHEYTHFIKELFAEKFIDRLPEEEMCYAVEKAAWKVIEKYLKKNNKKKKKR